MERRKLGRTGIDVSAICLGSMTWGSQNSEAEAHAQLDRALDRGVNFIDTAEGYPATPASPETYGRSESYVGSWIKARGRRDDIVLASKVAGPTRADGRRFREGDHRLDRPTILNAVDKSLQRLQTDYLDIYQVHWPDRKVAYFGERGLSRIDDHPDTVPIEETLETLGELVKAGKIRQAGVSNETPWGLSEYLRLSRDKGLPRIASIQNCYNLLNRVFELGLSEYALREDIALLAYSPLAAGNLTGKYLDGTVPAGSRIAVAGQFSRYRTSIQPVASARYVAIAREHGLHPATLALAFVNNRPFVTSTIIGVTSLDQLDLLIDAADVRLSDEVLSAIDAVQQEIPDPCP